MQNKYHVYNTLGQQIFFVQEGLLLCLFYPTSQPRVYTSATLACKVVFYVHVVINIKLLQM